ncbi:MAG TPA: tetratricopeptide repeat protein [Puia sp.]|nr:tetratricopeptide repeat protein [Puia sp.]
MSMRVYCTILFLISVLAALGQPGGVDPVRKRIDSLENQATNWLTHKNDSASDMIAGLASEALQESERAGYPHGIAVALACQAFLMNMHANDFNQSEKLARQSLDWFRKTDNKYAITLAYYALGFSLFAQSRFDEALYNFGQAKEYARRSGNAVEEIYMMSLTGEAYRERGDYEKAFDIFRQCIQMAEAINNTSLVKEIHLTLASMFVQIEDYSSAEKYFRVGFGESKPEHKDLWDLMVYTELLTRQHKYDSALYYYGRIDSARLGQATLRTFLVSKGEYYLFREDYATALPYFIKSLSYQRRLNDGNQIMRCLQDLSRTYAGLGQHDSAFRYAREGLVLANAARARQNIRDDCQMLYTLYDREGRMDSAYFYYRRYISMKDSVLNDQVKGKFASYGFEQQIKWLNQEKQLTDVCIRQEMLTKKILIGSIVFLLLIGFIYFRYIRLKRKNEAHLRKRAENELEIQRLEGERAKAALQQRAKELEVQALRSQMNPHFIFNCLNAINFFILNHETEAAADYLTKFSRLMRMIMNHSRYPLISLAEELEVLQLYLDMERLRFKNAFDYHIVLEDEPDTWDISIPPLLLQPFVENAIWHGLMHKEERGGVLTITIRVEGEVLTCIIRDNGIGRKRAASLKSKSVEKHKSMGLQITAERMALLTGADKKGPSFTIEDLQDPEGNATGTQVTLTIKINSITGENVLIKN